LDHFFLSIFSVCLSRVIEREREPRDFQLSKLSKFLKQACQTMNILWTSHPQDFQTAKVFPFFPFTELTPFVNFTNIFYAQILVVHIPKAQKDSQVKSVFLRFWDPCKQKMLIKCWWNRPLYLQQSILLFYYNSFFFHPKYFRSVKHSRYNLYLTWFCKDELFKQVGIICFLIFFVFCSEQRLRTYFTSP